MAAGLGFMIHMLGGGPPKSASDYYGRTIIDASFHISSEVNLQFDDGTKIRIYDGAQLCCENRYMTCDDDIKDLIGKPLLRIAVKEVSSADEDKNVGYGEHEICFLEIVAGDEIITIASHNEHNGYYGGIGLSIDEIKAEH